MSDAAVVFCLGPCVNCGRTFSFHPNLVPSVLVNGARQPICRPCVERANPKRAELGLPPIDILPGAYDPAPESSIQWDGP